MRSPAATDGVPRREFLRALGLAVGAGVLLDACGGSPPITTVAADTSLATWLAARPLYVAHRGGDADWVQGSADAYRHSVAWNPALALEVPVWSTADGVYVISEDESTAAVFGVDHTIPATPWATLARLRSTVGHRRMTRLVPDILDRYASRRILFVDNKSDVDPSTLLAVLARYGGPRRIVMKSYWQSRATPAAARAAGYTTWGYYYARDMTNLAATQARFDLLGLEYTAPDADFATMKATGKTVIAHVIPTQRAAAEAFNKGATGLMVSGVKQVVPHGSTHT